MKSKRITFYDLQLFSLKRGPKMSGGTLKSLLQMSAVQLKALLNTVWKVVDNSCTFLLGDPRLRWWETCCPTIFRNAMRFKVLYQLEDLTSVWKCVEIELSSVSCLNNIERLSFMICLHTKYLLYYSSKHDFAIFD